MKTLISILLISLLSLGAKSNDGCVLELSDSKRAEILNSLLDAQPKLNAVYDLHALAAYLKNPIPTEELLAPITSVEAQVLKIPAKDLRAAMLRLQKNVERLVIAMRPELRAQEGLRADRIIMEKGGIFRARAEDLATKIISTLESSRLLQATQKYQVDRVDSEPEARRQYLLGLRQILGALFKTYRQDVQEMIESIAITP